MQRPFVVIETRGAAWALGTLLALQIWPILAIGLALVPLMLLRSRREEQELARVWDEHTAREGLSAFRSGRATNLALLRGLKSAQWLRAGTQEGVGRIALCDLPQMMAEHDAAHRAEIAEWGEAARGRTR